MNIMGSSEETPPPPTIATMWTMLLVNNWAPLSWTKSPACLWTCSVMARLCQFTENSQLTREPPLTDISNATPQPPARSLSSPYCGSQPNGGASLAIAPSLTSQRYAPAALVRAGAANNLLTGRSRPAPILYLARRQFRGPYGGGEQFGHFGSAALIRR